MDSPKLILVHEFLGPEIWEPLIGAVAPFARPSVVEMPVMHTMDKVAWARGIDALLRAHTATEGPVALVLAVGGACGPAAMAAAEHRAQHAVLLNPDLTVAMANDAAIQVPAMPDTVDEMLTSLAPYYEGLVEHGTLPREAVRIMAEYAMASEGELDADYRARLLDLATDKLFRCFPIDPASLKPSSDPQGASDWLHHLAVRPDACTVWASHRLGLGPATIDAVRRAVPTANTELLTTKQGTAWLENPRDIAQRLLTILDDHVKKN